MDRHISIFLCNFIFVLFITGGSNQQVDDENICLQYPGNLIIANPDDCHSFYACQYGNAVKIICPNNSIFNPKLGNCDEEYTDCIINETYTILNNMTDKKDLMSEDIDDVGENDTVDSENDLSTSQPTTRSSTSMSTTLSTTSVSTSEHTSDSTSMLSTASTEPLPDDCETCSKPTPPSQCPLNDTNDPTFLPSHQFCDTFYLCYHGRPYEMFCPRGFYWSQEYGKCVLERESNCTDSSGSKAPDCPPSGIFFIPHTERCNLFYYCENGIRSIQQCAAFKQWDVVEQTCKLDISAKCIKTIPRSQRGKYYTL